MAEAPNTEAKLNARIDEIASSRGLPVSRAKMIVCSLIVSQMLPSPTIVKGGIGVKLRLGETGTRATTDFDVATATALATFKDDLDARLRTGWGHVPPSKTALKKNPDAEHRVAFTGRAKFLNQAAPEGVSAAYVMQPYQVTLAFLGRDWGSVKLEVGHDELDGTFDSEVAMAQELVSIAAELGFGDVNPVDLIAAELQLAQKIHAVTEPGSDRAHDLVDIQLLWDDTTDETKLRDLCIRTFEYRRGHTWPPGPLTMPNLLEPLYAAAFEQTQASGDSGILPTLEEALIWFRSRMSQLTDTTD